ncbi:relaxase domain-containing protein [Geomonas sp. Red421]|uniref:Relaxase domain-containing protein n=1 Tax=Geomonas anaerohicana TaxID=2798583 RepID=A0ABS0YK39_9BACT|nr:relaxase domain-containing protein [Geomonas anaerohicana]
MPVETHRAGNDCTFSAPKSVSIAHATGVDQVREAHDEAVLSVLSHLEEHYCHYRTPEGSKCGDMVAAKFDHATSRNVDPQLHSDVFVVNAVHTGEGSWRANEPRAIFQDQKSLGLLYRQALARELSEGGFEVNSDPDFRARLRRVRHLFRPGEARAGTGPGAFHLPHRSRGLARGGAGASGSHRARGRAGPGAISGPGGARFGGSIPLPS